MAPDANQTWYAAMRELGVEPGAYALSDEEAAAEYAASPDDPAREGLAGGLAGDEAAAEGVVVGASRRSSNSRPSRRRAGRTRAGGSSPRKRRRRGNLAPLESRPWVRVAAVLVAAAVLFAIGWNLVESRTTGLGADPSPGEQVAKVPDDPTQEDGPAVDRLPTDPTEDEGTANTVDDPTPGDESADPAMEPDPYTPASDGTFRIDGRILTRAEAEEHYSSLDTPYRSRGPHVDLYTNNGIDFGDRMNVAAEAAYRRSREFFGKTPALEEDQRMPVFVVRNTEEYNWLGGGWGGDEKSSAFYAFTTPWASELEKPDYFEFDIASVTQFSQADELTEVYVTHATTEQFIRRLIGSDALEYPPRWFIDGVSCYIGRWQKKNLRPWSQNRWISFGGAPDLTRFFDEYAPKEAAVLTGGAIISFIKSGDCPQELATSFHRAVLALNNGEGQGEAFGALEQQLAAAEGDFRAHYGL